MPEDGAKGSNISIIKKHLPSGKCFLRCWGESERVMRCEAAAKLPGGSPGRGCGRAVEVRVGKVRNKMDIQGTSNGEVEASL